MITHSSFINGNSSGLERNVLTCCVSDSGQPAQLRICEDSSRVPGMEPSKKAWCSQRVCAGLRLLMKLPAAFFGLTHMVTGGGTTNSLGLRMEKMISHGQGLQSDFLTGMQEADLGLQSSGPPVEQCSLGWPTLQPSLHWHRGSQDMTYGIFPSVCLMNILFKATCS